MRVLIVDDEPPARDRLRQLLDDTGVHQVVGEAGNGLEALEVAARENPDVVLLDIRMPGMDGIEAARHLNQGDAPPGLQVACSPMLSREWTSRSPSTT